jgi:hypothetical protein
MALKLVPDADQWHRWWSVRFAVAGAALSVGSVVFPGLLGIISPVEHPGHYAAISILFFAVTAISRVIDQPSLDKPDGHP